MTSPDPLAHELAGISQIRHNGHRSSAPGKPESHGVVGIMGQGKGIDHQIFEYEWGSSPKLAQVIHPAHDMLCPLPCRRIGIDRKLVAPRQRPYPLDVVAMFVGD